MYKRLAQFKQNLLCNIFHFYYMAVIYIYVNIIKIFFYIYWSIITELNKVV